jgi:hypothetical protein
MTSCYRSVILVDEKLTPAQAIFCLFLRKNIIDNIEKQEILGVLSRMRKLSKESNNFPKDTKLATLVVVKLKLWKQLDRKGSIALTM